jgi:hypothetical protein
MATECQVRTTIPVLSLDTAYVFYIYLLLNYLKNRKT